jgi:hypothetical protein
MAVGLCWNSQATVEMRSSEMSRWPLVALALTPLDTVSELGVEARKRLGTKSFEDFVRELEVEVGLLDTLAMGSGAIVGAPTGGRRG